MHPRLKDICGIICVCVVIHCSWNLYTSTSMSQHTSIPLYRQDASSVKVLSGNQRIYTSNTTVAAKKKHDFVQMTNGSKFPPTIINGKNINSEIERFYIMSEDEIKDPLVNLHQYNYTLNSNICDGRNIFLVILVVSAPRYTRKRDYIRNTYGTVRRYKNKDLAVIFLLGSFPDQEYQKVLRNESHRYGDIIQGNFPDTYATLTWKHLMAMHWFEENCASDFILKADDDTFINPYRTVDYLLSHPPVGISMHCYTAHGSPIRRPESKWYMDTVKYPFIKYPVYCFGVAYLTTPQTWSALLRVSGNTRKFDIDDVYGSGLLGLRVGMEIVDIRHHFYKCPWSPAKVDMEELNEMLVMFDRLNRCKAQPFEKWNEIRNMNEKFKE